MIQGGVRSDVRKLFPPTAHEGTNQTGLHNVAGAVADERKIAACQVRRDDLAEFAVGDQSEEFIIFQIGEVGRIALHAGHIPPDQLQSSVRCRPRFHL